MRVLVLLIVSALGFALAGCASIVHNMPLNTASANPPSGLIRSAAAAETGIDKELDSNDGAIIGLAFSGGGTRAAAFASGVLRELGNTPAPSRAGGRDLLDRVNIVSGVSGGSIMAAYYGLKGRAGLADFREKFLVQDLMKELETNVDLFTISRALGGGINTDNKMRDWLNAHLFDNATFGTLYARGRPTVLINATDIYSRTPFLFAPPTFAAFCSDITNYPVAGAVAASSAVPGAFAPVVIETFANQCATPLPPWVARAAKDSSDSPQLQSFAKALQRAHSGEVKYIKLLDGGLVDNYGLSGITIARGAAATGYAPLKPEEAVRMRRLLFLVVDAGRGPEGNWSQTLQGPTGKDLVSAVVDVLVDANTHSSYTAFSATMDRWRDALVRWRCGLKPAEVARLRGSSGPWNCRDVKFIIGRVAFAQLDAERADRLNRVPTSFTLPPATVDELANAGADALKANPAFREFLHGL